MPYIGGKSDSKRHFTVVMGGKEHGLYVSSTPSSAAKKAVTKLCTSNKGKKVDFYIREITQGSKKKTYGPYEGHIEKLKEPIELKGRVIKYKPVAKLSRKKSLKKGGDGSNNSDSNNNSNNSNNNPWSKNNYNSPLDKNEKIAFIEFRTPNEKIENTDELNKIIIKLRQLDSNIFKIEINNYRKNNWSEEPAKTDIFITFNNLSKAKNKRNFKEYLNALIEVLKYFKKQADIGEFDTEFKLFEPNKPNEKYFSPEHNEILRYLLNKI